MLLEGAFGRLPAGGGAGLPGASAGDGTAFKTKSTLWTLPAANVTCASFVPSGTDTETS